MEKQFCWHNAVLAALCSSWYLVSNVIRLFAGVLGLMSCGRYMGNALVRKERVGGDDKQVLHVPVSSSMQKPSHETPWLSARFVHV